MFEAIVLIGGFGTRLKSVSGRIPKPMMPIGEVPFLYLLLRRLETAGCSRIILSMYYEADAIKAKLIADRPVSCEIVFVVENQPLGTGGAIKHATKSVLGEDFIALNGDTFSDIDYYDFYKASVGNELVISGVNISDAQRYGALQFDKEFNLICMTEKGMAGPAVINGGTYFVKKDSISSFEKSIFSFENDFIPRNLSKTKVYLFEGNFIDIGIPEDYLLACATLS